jgi:hypothetical protein
MDWDVAISIRRKPVENKKPGVAKGEAGLVCWLTSLAELVTRPQAEANRRS